MKRGLDLTRTTALRAALRAAPGQRARILGSRLNPRWYEHAVGDWWETMGALQFDFLVSQGLEPSHDLLDVGCGSLRGGRHFVRYLDAGCYCGLDVDGRLLRAGEHGLANDGLQDKRATLVQDDAFRFGRFGRQFDMALAQSVFSHLPFNVIARCLSEMEPVLRPGGRFFATFFVNPGPRLRSEDLRMPIAGGSSFLVHCDADPFFYDPDIFRWVCDGSSLEFAVHGDWGHPRGQQMMVFTKKDV